MPYRNAAGINLARFSVILIAFLLTCGFARGDAPAGVAKIFPTDLGSFHRIGDVSEEYPGHEVVRDDVPRTDFAALRLVTRAIASYKSESGDTINLMILKFEDGAAAYSRFTMIRKSLRQQGWLKKSELDNIGTANLVSTSGVDVLQGPLLISFMTPDTTRAAELARLFASTLAAGEDDIPVLVKHLPQWEAENVRRITRST